MKNLDRNSKRGVYLTITPFFPTHSSFRGSFVYDQVKAIMKSGRFDEVVVIRPNRKCKKALKYRYQEVTVYEIPFYESPSLILNGSFNGLNRRNFLKRFDESDIKLESIRYVHCHVSYFAGLGLALKELNPNIKCILQHHDPDPFTIRNGRFSHCRWNLRYRALRNIELFQKVDLHVSVSRRVEENLVRFPDCSNAEVDRDYIEKVKLIKDLPNATIKESYVLHNGVDLEKFSKKSDHEAAELFNVGCVANFIDWKNQLLLIQALKELVAAPESEEVRLHLVGSGPCLADCKRFVCEHKLDRYVSFIDEIPHGDVVEFYNKMDLFVLPSTFEGFGCVFLESYACGVPFMTCKWQGMDDYIAPEESRKWLFEAHDARAIAESIRNFKTKRWEQVLTKPIDINILINDFLDRLERL